MTPESLTIPQLPTLQAPLTSMNAKQWTAPVVNSTVTINAANADAQDVAAEVERQQQALIDGALQNWNRTDYVTP